MRSLLAIVFVLFFAPAWAWTPGLWSDGTTTWSLRQQGAYVIGESNNRDVLLAAVKGRSFTGLMTSGARVIAVRATPVKDHVDFKFETTPLNGGTVKPVRYARIGGTRKPFGSGKVTSHRSFVPGKWTSNFGELRLCNLGHVMIGDYGSNGILIGRMINAKRYILTFTNGARRGLARFTENTAGELVADWRWHTEASMQATPWTASRKDSSGCSARNAKQIADRAFLLAKQPVATTTVPVFNTKQIPLTHTTGNLWEKPRIHVCWENANLGNVTERGWVQDAVEKSWERHSALNFVGWDACKPHSDQIFSDKTGIRIVINDEIHDLPAGLDTWPSVRYPGGKGIWNMPNGMELNFTFTHPSLEGKFDPCIVDQTTREGCIRRHAVHEFGHALGFMHEHNRENRPPDCTDEPQGPTGNVFLTPYDPNSVMNYCAAGLSRLSQLDILGVRLAYGAPAQARPNPNLDRWFYSVAATLRYRVINGGNDRLRAAGDFDGDEMDDVFATRGDQWMYSQSGTSRWKNLGRSSHRELFLGDMDGDGRTDVFMNQNNNWMVAWTGNGPAEKIARGRFNGAVRIADLDGDGADDVFHITKEGNWEVSWKGRSKWQIINRGRESTVKTGDFNGDGRADILAKHGQDWEVSWAGRTRWQPLNRSDRKLSELVIADVNGDRIDDILHVGRNDLMWINGGRGNWQVRHKDADIRGRNVVWGDFNGNGHDDFIVRWNK